MVNESKQKTGLDGDVFRADSFNGASNLKPLMKELNRSSKRASNPQPIAPQGSSASGVSQRATPVANQKTDKK